MTQRSGAVSMGGSPAFGVCARHGQNLTGESLKPDRYRNSDDPEYSLAKQEVSGDIECTGNADDIFATQLVRLAANETARRTLRHTDTSSKFRLCDFSEFFLFPFSPTFSAI